MRRRLAQEWIDSVGVFAEALLMGVVTAALALVPVTFVAGCAAGSAHIRRAIRGESGGIAAWWRDVRGALRGSWWVSLVMTAVVGMVIVVDQPLVRAGIVPGGPLVAFALALAAVIGVAVVIRAAALWEPGERWITTIESAVSGAHRRWALLVALTVALAAMTIHVLPLALALLGIALLGATVESIRAPRRREREEREGSCRHHR